MLRGRPRAVNRHVDRVKYLVPRSLQKTNPLRRVADSRRRAASSVARMSMAWRERLDFGVPSVRTAFGSDRAVPGPIQVIQGARLGSTARWVGL